MWITTAFLTLGTASGVRHPAVGFGPVIIHQVREGQQLELLKPNDEWTVLHKVADEAHAIDRLNEARKNPHYKLFANNCEQFGRYVTTGKRESHQVNITLALAGLALVAFAR